MGIDDIKISYSLNGIKVTLSLEDTDNLPYDLAEMFIKVIDDSGANAEIVVEELISNYDYKSK
jgi:hypothetical protein